MRPILVGLTLLACIEIAVSKKFFDRDRDVTKNPEKDRERDRDRDGEFAHVWNASGPMAPILEAWLLGECQTWSSSFLHLTAYNQKVPSIASRGKLYPEQTT